MSSREGVGVSLENSLKVESFHVRSTLRAVRLEESLTPFSMVDDDEYSQVWKGVEKVYELF